MEDRNDIHGKWVEKIVSMRFDVNAEFHPSDSTHRATTDYSPAWSFLETIVEDSLRSFWPTRGD